MSAKPPLYALLAVLLVPFAARAQELTDLPARVVDSNPKPLATNVDPKLQQISFTFDRPMDPRSQGGLNSLRFLGVMPVPQRAEPVWDATGTVLSLPVALEPDVTYAVALNDSKTRGLKDAGGVPACGYFLVFSTGARTAADFPPYVVKTEPALGAKDVDARLRQITVTFSRPVAPGDCSWALYQGSGLYPGERGGRMPQLSADRLTATLDVRLSPGTVYACGINDTAYFGYKDLNGRPVLPYGLCFQTAK